MERSKDWIDESEGDLEHAKNDLNTGYYNWSCFSAQQSAEKALKAVLQKIGADLHQFSATLLSMLFQLIAVQKNKTNCNNQYLNRS